MAAVSRRALLLCTALLCAFSSGAHAQGEAAHRAVAAARAAGFHALGRGGGEGGGIGQCARCSP